MTRTVGLWVCFAVVGLAAPAFGRDSEVSFSAREAAKSDRGKEHLLGVPFYLAAEKHPTVKRVLSEFSSDRSANGAFRSDKASCQSAFLDALRRMQEQARQDGADAIVDIVSTTGGKQTESPTDFRCVAGAMVVHVGLKGKLVELER
jgi:hypothetical protein